MQNTISEAQRPQDQGQIDNNAKAAESLPQSMNSDISLQKQSYFKNINITPINGSAKIEISTSQQQSTWEIPISCFNPYWTTISFVYDCPTAVLNNCFSLHNRYCPFFNRVELYSSNGNVYLVNQQSADIYSRLACPLNNDFRHRGEEEGPISISKRSIAGNSTTNPRDVFSSDPFVVLLNDNTTVVGLKASSYNEPQNAVTGTGYGAGDPATGGTIPKKVFSFRLGDILPDSFFNLNNSFYLSKVLYLRVTWNSRDYIYYTTSQAADANPSVFSNTAGPVDLLHGAASNITITNLALQCKIEGDEGMINAKRMLTQQPSTILVPYVYNWSQSTGGSGISQTSYTLASDGSKIFRLFRLYSGMVRSGKGNAAPIKIDCNNVGGTSITSKDCETLAPGVYSRVQLYINGIMIENFVVDPLSYNMFLKHIKEYFPDCSIQNSQDMLIYGGYATQFNTEQPPEEKINLYSNQIAKGLDASKSNLAINIQYDTTGASPAFPNEWAASLYLFPVVFKSYTYVNGSFEYS